MESQLPWNYVVCNLTMSVPTEQRSMQFSRTNITKFRRVLQISLTWFICVDQPSRFSVSWEYILCCTSCEQQSQRSHHFALWQKQTVAQDPYSFGLWQPAYTSKSPAWLHHLAANEHVHMPHRATKSGSAFYPLHRTAAPSCCRWCLDSHCSGAGRCADGLGHANSCTCLYL